MCDNGFSAITTIFHFDIPGTTPDRPMNFTVAHSPSLLHRGNLSIPYKPKPRSIRLQCISERLATVKNLNRPLKFQGTPISSCV